MNKLDTLFVSSEISYDQWVDGYLIFDSLGWNEDLYLSEIDRRWMAFFN